MGILLSKSKWNWHHQRVVYSIQYTTLNGWLFNSKLHNFGSNRAIFSFCKYWTKVQPQNYLRVNLKSFIARYNGKKCNFKLKSTQFANISYSEKCPKTIYLDIEYSKNRCSLIRLELSRWHPAWSIWHRNLQFVGILVSVDVLRLHLAINHDYCTFDSIFTILFKFQFK